MSGAWRALYFSLVCSPIVCKFVIGPSCAAILHLGYELIVKFKKTQKNEEKKEGTSKHVK